ncbi:MAG: hypothetical protein NPIRA03_17530 [Nitrospirales bacterium]|nr:MAG: hypothetical protein NPIRA03_17530 [Nitrospirales bacterium]
MDTLENRHEQLVQGKNTFIKRDVNNGEHYTAEQWKSRFHVQGYGKRICI